MSNGQLHGKRVAFVVANEGIEQVELTEPWSAVADAGGSPELIAPSRGEVQAMHHLDKGERFDVDTVTKEADPDRYDAVVLPGGVANPDRLRQDTDAVRFVRALFDRGKPVAVICHGPWTLIEAEVLPGRTVTSWPSLRTDLINAGARWVDQEVVVDDNLISSRQPDDLPAFCQALVDALS
jgi:protease I